jgi:hypothetical protein
LCATAGAEVFMGENEIIYGDNYDLDANPDVPACCVDIPGANWYSMLLIQKRLVLR